MRTVSVSECICGYKSHSISAHSKRCKQYREWKKMITDDPETKTLIVKLGISHAADKLGIKRSTLHNWFDCFGNLLPGSPKATSDKKAKIGGTTADKPDIANIELSPDQILQALRFMLNERVTLQSENQRLKEANVNLSQQNQELRTEIKRLLAKQLEPIKFNLERQAIIQNMDK